VVVLEESSTARYLSSGHLLYARAGSVFAIPFDVESLTVSGSPTLAIQSVSTDVSSGAVQFGVSHGGDLAYVAGDTSAARNTLSWIDQDGTVVPTGLDPGNHLSLSLSPDDTRMSLVSAMGPTTDVWIFDLERDALSRLTFEAATVASTWTPDGQRIAFGSSRDGAHTRIFWKDSDGSSEEELLFESEYPAFPGSFSPDGKWLAYSSDESGIYEVYVRAFPGPGGKWQVSTGGGGDAVWSDNGRTLYCRDGAILSKVAIDTTDGFKIGPPEEINADLAALRSRAEGGVFDVASEGRVLFLGSHGADSKRGEVGVVLN
jgi:WD40 repeat protein